MGGAEHRIQSLSLDLNVVNYKNMGLDKDGLKLILDLAVEGGILKNPIIIEYFTNEIFFIGEIKNG